MSITSWALLLAISVDIVLLIAYYGLSLQYQKVAKKALYQQEALVMDAKLMKEMCDRIESQKGVIEAQAQVIACYKNAKVSMN